MSGTAPVTYVAPRHLAGAGDSGLVLAHLREHGWRNLTKPGYPPARPPAAPAARIW